MSRKKIVPLDEQVRVIPADVYDTLELVALAEGGVGGGLWYAEDAQHRAIMDCPVCINGMAAAAGICSEEFPTEAIAGLSMSTNDRAVEELEMEDGIGAEDARGLFRVPFAAYCAKLNIVRGE